MSIPKSFFCPLTKEIMVSPVLLIEDRRTYEKSALKDWLQNHKTSPTTKQILKNKDFIENIALKDSIKEFHEKQQKARYCEKLSNALLITNGNGTKFDNNSHSKINIRISMFGDSYVGKTSILQYLQFEDQIRKDRCESTIAYSIAQLHLDDLFENQYVVTITVHDLAGSTRFSDVWPSHYKCHGAIFVCSKDVPKSLENISRQWYPKLRECGLDECQCIVACNKVDFGDYFEDQMFRDVEQFSLRNDLPLFYTSAVTGRNVKTMFNQLVLCILNNSVLLAQLKENNSILKNTVDLHRRSTSTTAAFRPENRMSIEEGKDKKKSSCC